MSGSLFFSLVWALWLGILTSISPCPLATNIAAVSYLANKIGIRRSVFMARALYTFGRILAYVALTAIVVGSLLSVPSLAFFLQNYVALLMGPLLSIVGVMLVGLIKLPASGLSINESVQRWAAPTGGWAPPILGVLFALAFFPVSAWLYFGALVPLAL